MADDALVVVEILSKRLAGGRSPNDSTDKVYHGFIGFISPTAEFTPRRWTSGLRTDLVCRLRVIVDNPDGGLRQGTPVTVILDISGASGQ